MTVLSKRHIFWQKCLMAGSSLVIIIAVFVSILQHFVLTLPHLPENTPVVDGIVVTTGGQDRLAAGLDLLSQNKAPYLLLSGVGEGITKQMIKSSLALTPDRAAQLECCVALEFQAKDTKGNALATKKWADNNQLSVILLVTADYHMPRAQLEFAAQMPRRTIVAYPINAADLDGKSWYSDWHVMRLYIREFLKYSLRRLTLLIQPS